MVDIPTTRLLAMGVRNGACYVRFIIPRWARYAVRLVVCGLIRSSAEDWASGNRMYPGTSKCSRYQGRNVVYLYI